MVANSTEAMKQRNEIRAANTLAMIVGTFIILWTPGIISLFVMALTENREFPLDILELSTILVHFNASLDPLIYAYRMRNIREALKKIFKCGKRSEQRPTSSNSTEKRSLRTSNTWTSNSCDVINRILMPKSKCDSRQLFVTRQKFNAPLNLS